MPMKRRHLALLLVAVALGVWLHFRRVEAEHHLVLHFGAASAHLREADLHFLHDGEIARDVTLWFPSGGAPAEIERTLRLVPGRYEVGVRLVRDDGRESHVARQWSTDSGDSIDLSP
jgi:hypothetical protein